MMKMKPESEFNKLPPEAWLMIFENLDLEALLSFRNVDSSAKQLVEYYWLSNLSSMIRKGDFNQFNNELKNEILRIAIINHETDKVEALLEQGFDLKFDAIMLGITSESPIIHKYFLKYLADYEKNKIEPFMKRVSRFLSESHDINQKALVSQFCIKMLRNFQFTDNKKFADIYRCALGFYDKQLIHDLRLIIQELKVYLTALRHRSNFSLKGLEMVYQNRKKLQCYLTLVLYVHQFHHKKTLGQNFLAPVSKKENLLSKAKAYDAEGFEQWISAFNFKSLPAKQRTVFLLDYGLLTDDKKQIEAVLANLSHEKIESKRQQKAFNKLEERFKKLSGAGFQRYD